MKIGIIALSLNKNALPGFYNSQELGMGKALAAAGHSVIVYKLFSRAMLPSPKAEQIQKDLMFQQIPARSLGINGFFDKRLLDKSLDALICFCDTQLYTKSIAKWCRVNCIPFYPYVGVLKSASTNPVKRRLMDLLTGRLIRFYRRQPVVWGKTPAVCEALSSLGVTRSRLVPIGLDTGLLHGNYADADPASLKKAHGFSADAQILLFIGRLVPEKEPLTMISLFAGLYPQNPKLRLCMIGTGALENDVKAAIASAGIGDAVSLLPRVPNGEMWEYYRMSCCYVNLNRHEIYGMAILEAMYYECPVIAFHAPGPDFILNDGQFGCLCASEAELLSALSAVVSPAPVSAAPTTNPALATHCAASEADCAVSAADCAVSAADCAVSAADCAVSAADCSVSAAGSAAAKARERVLSHFLWERCLPPLSPLPTKP